MFISVQLIIYFWVPTQHERTLVHIACNDNSLRSTAKPVYSGHLGTQQNCPDYRCPYFRGSFIHIYIVTVNCPYYRGVLISECPQ